MIRSLIVLLYLPLLVMAAPHHEAAEPQVLAPGYADLGFEAPAAGSYWLPVLGDAPDGEVVTDKGDTLELHGLLGDRFVVLSFIYTSCSDVNGCPLASFVLKRVQDAVLKDEALKNRVRLLSLSFDRQNDSPEVLKRYGDNFRQDGFDWQFLTTPSDEALASLLHDYDQFIIPEINNEGEQTGAIAHVLRVYLIDTNRQFRNIYSVSFLHPDIIMNDIRTILSEAMEILVQGDRR